MSTCRRLELKRTPVKRIGAIPTMPSQCRDEPGIAEASDLLLAVEAYQAELNGI